MLAVVLFQTTLALAFNSIGGSLNRRNRRNHWWKTGNDGKSKQGSNGAVAVGSVGVGVGVGAAAAVSSVVAVGVGVG